jgi:subtilisin family serine protease
MHRSGGHPEGVARLASLLALALALLSPAAAHAAADPLRPQQWNLDLIDADAAHATSTGAGATVAIVDSGVQADHPDLVGRLVTGWDAVEGDATPQDGAGHGTHVTGIVGAASGNGIGIEGVAPGARLMPVRVLDANGSGSAATVAAGIDWARAHGADVINLSLGSDVPLVGATGAGDMDAAIRRVLDAGIVVVAAAGNNSVPVCEQPAASAGLLCVGAVDRRGQHALYSSFGSGLGVVAPGGSALGTPGEDVLSTYPTSGYAELAGTSQATPHMSGVAALLVACGLREQDAVRRILATTSDLGPPGPDPAYGYGLVNARAAVAGLSCPHAAGAGGSGSAGVPAPFARRARRLSARRLLRSGVRVRVRAASAGVVRVRVTRRGRTLALGSRKVAAGRAVTVVARLTASGRRRARTPRRFAIRVRVRLPGEVCERVLTATVIHR